MDNKRKTIIISVILVVLIISASWFFVFRTKHYTVKEMNEKYNAPDSFESGDVVKVKDIVTDTVEFQAPSVTGNNHYFKVNESNMIDYTAIWFESAPTYPLFFWGQRASEFPIGEEISISIEAYEYTTLQFYNLVTLETSHPDMYLLDFYASIFAGNYSIITFDTQIDNDKLKLTVVEINNIVNESIFWSDMKLNFYIQSVPNSPVLFEVYNSQNNYLGDVNFTVNTLVHEEVKIGDYATLDVDEVELGDSEILISGDIFPNHEGDGYSYFDEFGIASVEL